jgi:hypothetical protein
MNIETVKQQLRELKLKVAAAELDETLQAHKKNVSLDWLSSLLSAEIDARRASAVESRIRRAEFPEITTLEAFNWEFNPDINRTLIEELATLEFVHKREVALFLGKPGTGKTHLALALGIRAVHSGVRVYCSSMKRLVLPLPSPGTLSTDSSNVSSGLVSGSSMIGASSLCAKTSQKRSSTSSIGVAIARLSSLPQTGMLMSGALCFQIPSSLALLSTASSTTLTSLLSQATAIDSRAESRSHPYTLPKKPKEVTKKTQTDIYTADHVRGIEADLFSGTRQLFRRIITERLHPCVWFKGKCLYLL